LGEDVYPTFNKVTVDNNNMKITNFDEIQFVKEYREGWKNLAL
jgi:hypothetical protein